MENPQNQNPLKMFFWPSPRKSYINYATFLCHRHEVYLVNYECMTLCHELNISSTDVRIQRKMLRNINEKCKRSVN